MTNLSGFNGNTTAELCARWHQLGAGYSFSRNHNTDDGIEQDPVALGKVVEQAAKEALLVRYAHLPYLYTLFYKANRSGGTVLRPLFFEFPNDTNAGFIDEQFMWGSAMMFAPALNQGETVSTIYFPAGTWYHSVNYARATSTGQFMRQKAGFDVPNVYYRAGSIVPTQEAKVTTDETRAGNVTLVVVLENENGKANGNLYWDSGDGLDTEELGHYNLYNFQVYDVSI